MNVNITFRHLEATDNIKNHVREKLKKLEKYLIKPIDAHVILSVPNSLRQICEITVTEGDFQAVAKEETETLYASIDQTVHKIERQLKKHKEIVKEHKSHDSIGKTAAKAEAKFQEVQ